MLINPNNWKDELLYSLALLMLMMLITILSGCKTIENVVVDKTTTNKQDSVRIEIRHQIDTITQEVVVYVRDTASNERSEATEIVFVDGGGTYNATTGEATNVVGVKTSATEKQLRVSIANLEQTNAEMHRLLEQKTDSIAQLKQKADVSTTHKETANHWYWWLIVGILIGIVAVIVLKRVPIVGVFLQWI